MSGKVEKGEHVCLIRSNSFQLRITTYILIISIKRKILWLTANHWWLSSYQYQEDLNTIHNLFHITIRRITFFFIFRMTSIGMC
jgi:hypothetical protein